MTTPLIAVVTYHLEPGRVSRWTQGGYAVPDLYVEAVRRAGGRPVLLTEPDAADPREILAPFHGMLLLGGGDIEPRRYGAEPSDVYGLEPDRDELELALVQAADVTRLPTLAVCRGFQVLNVAFGGTLHQHLPDLTGLIPHGTPGGGEPVMHDVRVAPASRLRRLSREATLSCSSHHHQGVDRPGRGLVATAWTGDDLVEALEREHGWMVGVQWHPEETAGSDPTQQALFDELTREARERSDGADPPGEHRI
jgi:putative glutamine amidotransferase